MTNLFIIFLICAKIVQSVSNPNDLSVFGQCLKVTENRNIMNCVGQQAIHSLQILDDSNNFTITSGLTMYKDENADTRSISSFLDQDPMDFRGILENAGAVFGQRSLQWDLSRIHPGLNLRIGPSTGSESMLEFVMDEEREIDERHYLDEEPSTARILAKKFILPFLLGLKLNLVAIVPIIFAVIIVLCKKAAILAKFALFISGLFGLGGALSLGALATGYGGHHGGHGEYGGFGGFGGFGGGHGGILTSGYGSHIKPSGLGSFSGSVHHHDNGYYRSERKTDFNKPREYSTESTPVPDHFYNYEKNILLLDRNSKLYEKSVERDGNGDEREFRSFGWKTVE